MAALERRDVNDPGALRALAHPLRLRLLDQLRFAGPATATVLAGRLGQSSGATSYHLRQLAKYGFVEEDPGRGSRRERWWRHVPADFRFAPVSPPSGELRAASDDLARFQLDRDLRLLRGYLSQQERWPDWRDAVLMSNSATHLTRAELAELGERLIEVVKRYSRPAEARPPGAEPVALLMYGFPWPDPDAQVDADPELNADPEPDPNADPEPDPELNAQPDPDAEPDAEPGADPEPPA
jgi:DNA-binding transcriptional ArsR family regulator